MRDRAWRQGRWRAQARAGARDAQCGPVDALAPARCGKRAVQGARPCRRRDHGDCRGGGRVSEPDHLLFPHQGGALRRSGLPRHAAHRGARRGGRRARTDAGHLHARAGRHRDGGRRACPVRRGARAVAPAHRSRAAGCTHDRAIARRWRARLCGRGVTPRVARLQRAGRDRAQVLGDRTRRRARGPGHGPQRRRNVRRDARSARRDGRGARCCGLAVERACPFNGEPLLVIGA